MMLTESVTLTEISCGDCGIHFAMPEDFRQARRRDGRNWFCPNGHARVYRETEADRLRKQLEEEQRRAIRLTTYLDAEVEERRAAERSASAFKGQATKLRKRAANGVCPAGCQRHFANLGKHMAGQHPGWQDAEVTE